MRIAIYDTQRDNLIDEERIVNVWRVERKEEADIECFDSRRQLYERHARRPFDLIFIDTGLRKEGLELAKNIRYDDREVKIVFMSKTADCALDSYKVKASQYFLKPLSQVEVRSFLDEFLGGYDIRQRGIMIREDGRNQRLLFKNIVLIESLGKYVLIKLEDGEEKQVLRSLKSIEEELYPQDYFFKPHRSFLISMKYVMQFSSQEIRLMTGDRIPISRGKAKEFKTEYLGYISR